MKTFLCHQDFYIGKYIAIALTKKNNVKTKKCRRSLKEAKFEFSQNYQTYILIKNKDFFSVIFLTLFFKLQSHNLIFIKIKNFLYRQQPFKKKTYLIVSRTVVRTVS